MPLLAKVDSPRVTWYYNKATVEPYKAEESRVISANDANPTTGKTAAVRVAPLRGQDRKPKECHCGN